MPGLKCHGFARSFGSLWVTTLSRLVLFVACSAFMMHRLINAVQVLVPVVSLWNIPMRHFSCRLPSLLTVKSRRAEVQFGPPERGSCRKSLEESSGREIENAAARRECDLQYLESKQRAVSFKPYLPILLRLCLRLVKNDLLRVW